MKYIENGKENIILFSYNNEDLSGLSAIHFEQIGTEIKKSLPATLNMEDCFTFSIAVNLTEDFTPNGMYTIDVIDNSESRSIVSATAIISAMIEDNKRAYIIEDVSNDTGSNSLKLAMTLTGKL